MSTPATAFRGAVRLILTLGTLAVLLASVRPAAADSISTAGLEQQLRDAHFARIGVAGRTWVLVRPRGTQAGLGYERVEGFPPRRPAIITGAGWDSLPPLDNPVPWTSIDRIEAGMRTRKPGATWGGAIGLLAGLTVGWMAYYGASMSGDNMGVEYAIGAMAIGTATGASIGALFPSRRWKPIDPPKESSQP